MTDVRYVNSDFPKPLCGDTGLAWRCQLAVSTSRAAGSFVLLQCPAPWVVLAQLLELPAGRGADGSDQCLQLLCKGALVYLRKVSNVLQG